MRHSQFHAPPKSSRSLHRVSQISVGLIGLAVSIVAFQNCSGSGSSSGDTPNSAASTTTGVVSLLPESGLTNPRVQVLSDNWTTSGANTNPSRNLGCVDVLQSEAANCSAWSLIQTKQVISQVPGALIPSGVSVISDPTQLVAFADTDWGTALYEILSVTANSTTGAASGSLRASDSSGLTAPGTFRIYRDRTNSRYGFELAEQNGFTNASGGQIEALQADFLPIDNAPPTLKHPATLKFSARVISHHMAFYTNPADTLNVRTLFFSQASLGFKNSTSTPGASRIKSLRLKFIHGDSANYTLPVTNCTVSDSGYEISLQQNLPAENIRYDLRAGTNLNSYQIDLNAHLCSLLSQTLTCNGQIAGQTVSQSFTLGSLPGAADLANWTLLTEQTGLETSKAQASATNANSTGDALGEIATRIQLENLQASQDLDQTYTCPTGTSTRVFTQGVQTIREVCGYGSPIGINWNATSQGCYQKIIGDQKCVAGKIVKTACAVPNPGTNWTPIDDECSSFTTTTSCP